MDLYAWTLDRITVMERQIRDREGVMWSTFLGAESVAEVLFRRCAADRKLLTVHKPRGMGWDLYACEGCGYDGSHCPEPITAHANDCPVLLAVAEGYGLTPEILAGLERPAPVRLGKRQSALPKALTEAYGAAIMQSLRTSAVLHRVGEGPTA